MAGQLTISTLSDGVNSTSSTNCIQGSAKVWVNFVGSTGAISSSYNVSSLTRNGTGDYTINFTTALASANYAVSGSGSGTSGYYVVYVNTTTTPTASLVRILNVTQSAGSPVVNDTPYTSVTILR